MICRKSHYKNVTPRKKSGFGKKSKGMYFKKKKIEEKNKHKEKWEKKVE